LRWRNDSAAPAGHARAVEPRTLRIIIADDHLEIRLAMVKLLERQFLIIDAVACGRALVEAALALTPDVIVSDVSMPTMSGIDAMKLLADAGCTAPFVLVSVGAQDPLEWINRGALAVVDKFDLHTELVAAVRSAASGFSYLSTRVRRSSG
jgi:DNA-binding NarL/FixJ family response regulator